MTRFDERMAALRGDFIDRASADASTIEGHAAAGEWPKIRDLSHGIVGRAGIFGFPEISDDARELERAVECGAPEPHLSTLAKGLIRGLRSLARGR